MKEIPLTQGKIALVDDEDFEFLNQWKWCVRKSNDSWYAVRGSTVFGKKRTVLMHRVIMNTPKDMVTDHVNTGDTLNNQKNNLRICTHSQNHANTRVIGNRKYKGVYWNCGKWMACIGYQGRNLYLGKYSMPDDAARAYDKKALELYGEFARTNFEDVE